MKNVVIVLLAVLLLTGCSNTAGIEGELTEAKADIERVTNEKYELEQQLEILEDANANLEVEYDALVEAHANLDMEYESLQADYETLLSDAQGSGETQLKVLIAELSVGLLGQPVDTVLSLLGDQYENVAVSVEGCNHGYLYEEYGIIAARYNPEEEDQTIYGIYLTEDNEYRGTSIGMTLDEVIGIMGETEKVSVMTEGQEYWIFYDYDDYGIEYRALDDERVRTIALRLKDEGYYFRQDE